MTCSFGDSTVVDGGVRGEGEQRRGQRRDGPPPTECPHTHARTLPTPTPMPTPTHTHTLALCAASSPPPPLRGQIPPGTNSDSFKETGSGSVGARGRTQGGAGGGGGGWWVVGVLGGWVGGGGGNEARGIRAPHSALAAKLCRSQPCELPALPRLLPPSRLVQLTGDDAAAADLSPQGAQEAGACADGSRPYRQAPEAPGWTR